VVSNKRIFLLSQLWTYFLSALPFMTLPTAVFLLSLKYMFYDFTVLIIFACSHSIFLKYLEKVCAYFSGFFLITGQDGLLLTFTWSSVDCSH